MKFTLPIAVAATVVCLAFSDSSRASPPAPEQRNVAIPPGLRIRAEANWKEGMFLGWRNGESNLRSETFLEVVLIAQGGATATATGCGDVDVESIRDENGQPVKADLTGGGGMHLIGQGNMFFFDPKHGVRVSFGLRRPPSLKKLSELRGSFALRVGGRLQEVILKDALKQNGRVINDPTLKSLGVTVHVTRTTRTEAETKAFSFHTPGEPDDALDILEFEVRNGEIAAGGYARPTGDLSSGSPERKADDGDRCAVTHLDVTDTNGTPFRPLTANVNYGSSIGKVELCFKEKLPDAGQLRLTIHRDARTVRVPFALKDIDIPRKTEAGATGRLPAAPISKNPT